MSSEQFEKNIRVGKELIGIALHHLPENRRLNVRERVIFNYSTVINEAVYIGQNEWRRGNSPVAAMNEALNAADELVAAIDEFETDHDVYADVDFRLIESCAYLMNNPFRWSRWMYALERGADIALRDRLNKAVRDEPYQDGLEDLLEKLAASKRRALAVASYRTYFALLDAKGDDSRIAALVADAEANYRKRARDAFYNSGPSYDGGGPNNPYVVDIELAIVLKSISWEGDCIHCWRWG
jgi:hypothetical protein